MLALIQRVNSASVSVDNKVVGSINEGLCILLGVSKNDSESDIDYLVEKILKIKLFTDESHKFAYTLKDIKGSVLVISQFTLYGNLKKGTKPDFSKAMQPKEAKVLYNLFCEKLAAKNINVQTGEFGAYMKVDILNDGPVTFNLSSDHLHAKD